MQNTPSDLQPQVTSEPKGKVFDLGDLRLQTGRVLPDAKLTFQTYGTLNAAGTNAIVFPLGIQRKHTDNEFMIGSAHALDPTHYFIIVPNLFGNGLSSSPSNTPSPHDGPRFPHVSIYDNVVAQHRLLVEHLGVREVALAVGWSMGALQAYHWAALFPNMVRRLAAIAGAARASAHLWVFLEGMKAVLRADPAWKDGDYQSQPLTGLRAVGSAWAAWGFSPAFLREHRYRDMGFASLPEFMSGYWENMLLERDANNMLAHLTTAQDGDISSNATHGGNFDRALAAIQADTIVMPSQTDQYFPVEDNAYEVKRMPRAELRVIPSIWGHAAGSGRNPADTDFIDAALRDLLAR